MAAAKNVENDFEGVTPENVRLSLIDTAPALLGRAGLNLEVVERYADPHSRGNLDLAPVYVYCHHNHFLLADGLHRFASAGRCGRKEILAYVKRCCSLKEAEDRAKLFAVGGTANDSHGYPATNEDKRARVRNARLMFPDASHRRIATIAGVSNYLAKEVFEELVGAGEIENKTPAGSYGLALKPNRKKRGEYKAPLPPPPPGPPLMSGGTALGSWGVWRVSFSPSGGCGHAVRFAREVTHNPTEFDLVVSFTQKRGVMLSKLELLPSEIADLGRLLVVSESLARMVTQPGFSADLVGPFLGDKFGPADVTKN